ncbi:hypothetical protein DFH94DRAFT_687674 [Russula ochroleuca]|uniref:DUF7918 domain-containing protein n=1 Tax=Russula ochroleuca TaxID=152965 RepID=A0A9P5N5Y8_9AGAM|nr:hypothetical protein DFH94DRAFT_687674 [Russula ochroleuca]
MPLSLLSLNFAIICEGNELETYDVKEGPNSIMAFVASEAGKKFSITYKNDLLDVGLSFQLYIDGRRCHKVYLEAGLQYEVLGIRKSTTSILPFKLQELEVVDPDVENAPVVPEMGTIELRAFRYRAGTVRYRKVRNTDYRDRLHQGRVSERSKKAGWHYVSTADEVPSVRAAKFNFSLHRNYIDPRDVPYASVKVVYRPRELLMAQGVIAGHDVGAGNRNREGSEVNDRKRPREDGSPGPSKRHTRFTVKKEDMSALSQQIQALQAESNSIMAEESRSSVKRELRSPSPIVVGQAAGEVIDLTFED